MDLTVAREELLEQLLEDISLTGLLEKCARLLGSPLRFTFHGGPEGFMVTEDYPIADVIRSRIETSRQAGGTDDSFRILMEQFEREHGGTPFAVSPETPALARRLLCVVRANGQLLGLLILPEHRRPLEEIDRPLMALCARCIGFRMLQSVRDSTTLAAQQGMHMLLSFRGATYDDFIGVTGSAALPRSGTYRLMVLRRQDSDESQRVGVLGAQIARLLSTEWYTFQKQEAVVLFDEGHAVAPVRRQIDQLLEIGGACACLSPVFRDLMDAAVWHRRMARLPSFLQAAPGTLTFYEDWLDWGLFGEAKLEPGQLEAFLPRDIMAIRDHDREHGTQYLRTLSAYINSGGRRNQTAVALGTHLNTVNYRLQKMEELFGLDLHAPAATFRILFGIRLMEYLDSRT